MKLKHIIGVDEAGRGALAGPVSVGAALVPHNFDWSLIPGVRDSKQLSPKKREEIYTCAAACRRAGMIDFKVALVSEKVIDAKGITYAVKKGIVEILTELKCDPKTVEIKLDGLLHAPEEFLYQETIIKGDALVPAISLASIVAKVTRDRFMVRLAKKYPLYSLDIHKGYGTLMHRTALKNAGISLIHRKSFCGLY